MSKRHMTEQQRRRIEAGQDRVRDKAGAEPLLEQALVIAHLGKALLVYHEQDGRIERYPKRPQVGLTVVGDRVVVEAGVVSAILPRQTVLYKYPERGGGRPKPLAANIDQVVIVVAPLPVTPALALDRCLLSAEYHGLTPILLFNKQDLLTDPSTADDVKSAYMTLRDTYRRLPYQQADLSVTQQLGLSALSPLLSDKTSLFLGQSGVGKSSLIQYLSQDASVVVGDLSQKTAVGKHTTTVSRWYFLSNLDAAVVDSPGIRMLSLPRLTKEALAHTFVEFKPYLGQCRFRNCRHQENSLGCALIEAQEKGQISLSRLTSYWYLCQEMS